ncbi:GFA family protein [Bradyrhizobium sp.]|uniref:GFA family protein n=1 Tax=Bradyrhizobium sp. TaxID=376 RepID=UPI003438DF0F
MKKAAKPAGISKGQCRCGKIRLEIDTPARWAWHGHSPASRRAHGAAYATYVGSWRKRLRITSGKSGIARYEHKASGTVRSFCATCSTPLFYERVRAPHMINVPRTLLEGRTGRQPLYHIAIEELQERAYTGEPNPAAMLFDEQTSALDPEMISEVLDVMVDLAREGMTMMVVTHEMSFASKVANRVIMDKSEIVEDALKTDFFGSPRSDRAQKFLSKILSH